MVSTNLNVQNFPQNDDDKPEPRSKFNTLDFFSDEIEGAEKRSESS